MDQHKEQLAEYRIPDNFIDEPRIFMGAVKRRNFFEGILLALIGAVPGYLIPVREVTARITVMIVFCAPFLIIGTLGFNGDPISRTAKNYRNYIRSKGLKVYNPKIRILRFSPLEDMLNQKLTRDKVVEAYDSYRKRKESHIQREDELSDQDYFAYDPDVDDYLTKKRRDGKRNSNDIRIEPKKSETIRIVANSSLNDFQDLYDLDDGFIYPEEKNASWATETAKIDK